MKQRVFNLISNNFFEYFIIVVIIVNSALIGVETYITHPVIHLIQQIILLIFTIEIIARWIARENAKSFFSDAWNIFDLSLVLISYIPESLFLESGTVIAIRVLRVFRVLRLLRTLPEIRLIISVLFRSISALLYNCFFFFIFMYLFAIVGVTLFRLPDAKTADPKLTTLIAEYHQIAPNAPSISPDPFGTLGESMFTLFRVLTGEDWTDIRYNLVIASKMGLIQTSETVITIYHVFWFILSAFLLINLMIGAILNNYQIVFEEERKKKLINDTER